MGDGELSGDDTFFVDSINNRVGVGTLNPGSRLMINGNGNDNIIFVVGGDYPAVSTDGTNYYKQVEIDEPIYNIGSGVTDNGYRIGLAVQGYVYTNDFAGTLNNQYGAWIRTGANSNEPTGTINNSYAVYIDNLTAPNVTIGNTYGIYQSS